MNIMTDIIKNLISKVENNEIIQEMMHDNWYMMCDN